ncbi:MAG TPA: beta-ketoacyl synthase N-terminal-like domain-containing protein [Gaiellaceae bacterium]
MTSVVVIRSGSLAPAASNGHGTGPRTIADFDPAGSLRMRGLRPLSRASLLACVAAGAALGHPGEPPGEPERRAVVLGTRWASLDPLFEFEQTAARDGPSLVNPAQFPNVVVNAHAGYLGILFGLAGPSVTICGPGAGLEAIGRARDLLLLDRADYALAGGVEALGEPLLRGLEQTAAEPPGEAAAFLLLAREEPGLPAVARLASYTSAPLPRSEGLIEQALELAALRPEDVRALWTAGRAPARLRGLPGPSRVGAGFGGAGGAMAAVAAAHAVAETSAPTVAATFPPEGTQSVLVLTPA